MSWAIIAIFPLLLTAAGCTAPQENSTSPLTQTLMKITSTAFQHSGTIPSKYTCDGDNINPPVNFADIPNETKSLILIVHDPDAPVGDWLHWTLWNMSPNTKEIAENSVPSGAIQGTTDFGTIGYGGPCPPSGTHRYFFELYALDTTLELPEGSNRISLESKIQGQILEKAELVGLYQRQK